MLDVPGVISLQDAHVRCNPPLLGIIPESIDADQVTEEEAARAACVSHRVGDENVLVRKRKLATRARDLHACPGV